MIALRRWKALPTWLRHELLAFVWLPPIAIALVVGALGVTP